MYDENERNERHDQDVDYTEGAYSDSAYEEKNNDTAKKEETSDYGGYHDSCYRGSLDGEPEAAAGADPKENVEKQPERSYIPEERSGRGHGSKNTGKKIAALVMSGILFGCVAGGTMVFTFDTDTCKVFQTGFFRVRPHRKRSVRFPRRHRQRLALKRRSPLATMFLRL